MSSRPHRPRSSGSGCAPALVAVTTAAGAGRAATPPAVADTVLDTLSVAPSPGPVIGSVCTGYGGLDLGVLAAFGGGRIAWCADPDPYIDQVLTVRMPGVPNLGDIRAIDWATVEPVEVLVAGFPCQDISAAGKRAGIENGARSGLWTDIVAGIRVLRPALVVVENVAALRWRNGGLHRVLGDLAEAGYDALWRSVRAADIGATHRRERVFLLAWPRRPGSPPQWAPAAHTEGTRPQRSGPESSRDRSQRGNTTAADHDHVGREELRRQNAARWADAARRSAAAADTEGLGHRHGGTASGSGIPTAAVATGAAAGRPAGVPSDAASNGRDQGLPGTAGLERGPDAALGGDAAAAPAQHDLQRRRHLVAVPEPANPQPAKPGGEVAWGAYAAAVRRWEKVLGRATPFPTQPGTHGRPVLSPRFVEHLMGLEPGWVTDLPLPRTAQLRALGNGVVPQQATYAVAMLLADLTALLDIDQSKTRQEVAAA